MSYSLRFASPADAAELLRIFSAAFSHDRITRLKASYHGEDPNYVESLIEAPLKSWLSRPDRYRVLKAVRDDLCTPTNSSASAVGWICWGFHEYSESEVVSICEDAKLRSGHTTLAMHNARPVRTPVTRPEDYDRSEAMGVVEESTPPPTPSQTIEPRKPIAELEELCAADMQQWLSTLLSPGVRCMYITAFCVEPEAQGVGIGSLLLNWGTRIADVQKVQAWVHSSEDGERAFASQGFREIGRLEIWIGDYTEDANLRPSMPYIYRYMVRTPSTTN